MQCSNTQIYHSFKDCAPNWPIPVTVGMFGILYTDSKSDDNHKMAPSRHTVPVTVGTFEITKGQKRRQIRRFRAFMAVPLPDHSMGGPGTPDAWPHVWGLGLRAHNGEIEKQGK